MMNAVTSPCGLGVCLLGFTVWCVPLPAFAEENPAFALESVEKNFQAPPGFNWMQARVCTIPAKDEGAVPQVLLTMQLHAIKGSHSYLGIVSALSSDLGKTWEGPTEQSALDHRHVRCVIYETPVDATPQWHARRGRVLLVGTTFFVDHDTMQELKEAPSDIIYAVYDPEADQWDPKWAPWKKLKMPRSFSHYYARAGCVQFVELSNGDVLLPIYYGEHANCNYYASVVRCRFDGRTLSYIEHGNTMHLDFGRGFYEPSLAKCLGRFFLTLRNDKAGYVTVSDDGLHFAEPQLWRFDDGKELGNYNTQQHWITHKGRLYLVYTRRGADNDSVFRHRAPLFMSEVDQSTLRVMRSTEQIVVPKWGDRSMGNFGVSHITPTESWIVVGAIDHPIMKDLGPNVMIGRIRWAPREEQGAS